MGQAGCESPSVLRQDVPRFLFPVFVLLWIASAGVYPWMFPVPSGWVGSLHPSAGDGSGCKEGREERAF